MRATDPQHDRAVSEGFAMRRRMRAAGSHVDGDKTHPDCRCGVCRHEHEPAAPADSAPMLTKSNRGIRHEQTEAMF